MAKPKENERYTYADYYSWDDGNRWELIDGVPYAMSPAPSPRHQSVLGGILVQLWQFSKGKSCEVLPAPFDVRLNPEGEDDTVVQPDVIVLCDRSKLDDKACVGVPDFVVEILSPSTVRMDRLLKFNKYLAVGVKEYWIIEPEKNYLQVNLLDGDKYIVEMYDDTESAPVHVLDGYRISLPDVFSDE